MTARLSVNLNEDTSKLLRQRSTTEGRSVTEIVRRMAAVYKVITEAVESGKEVQIVGRDGSVTVVSLL